MEEEYMEIFYDKKTKRGIAWKEWDAIRVRRKELGLERETREGLAEMAEPELVDKPPFDTFGLALSGGGIRSATFNLGFLKALNEKGILKYADYLSTVSGGGYIGSFVQNRLRETHDYDTLFEQEEIEHLKAHGDYLRPGKGIRKVFESFSFYLNTLIQIVLHSLWYILFFAFILFSFIYIGESLPGVPSYISEALFGAFALAMLWYYFFHALRHLSRRLWSAGTLFYINSVLVILIGAAAYSHMEMETVFGQYLGAERSIFYLLLFAFAMLFTGFFANPNILSIHRLYRFRLKNAFLRGSNRKLHELVEENREGKKWTFAPYPLINTTLNVQDDKDMPGMKSCDYFLLSPMYCGYKSSKKEYKGYYTPTDRTEYRRMTLATALTISGAAVNPSMGYKSNRVLAFFMTLLNLRLGYWALNPRLFNPESYPERSGARGYFSSLMRGISSWSAKKYHYALTLWPYYNIAELFGTLHSRRIRVNLSDGGNIENLAVFELLRRKCRLVIASDAGADPDYAFSDLKNLLIRARNELEISIEFSEEQDPEKIIRPGLRTGESARHYAIGNIFALPGKGEAKEWIGHFIYVKASVTAQKTKSAEEAIYQYKSYHPDFPHESTVDQFFDAEQWEAYRKLGEEIGRDLFSEFDQEVSIGRLMAYFDAKEG